MGSAAQSHAYWSQSAAVTTSALASSRDGLRGAVAAQRLATYGSNALETKAKVTALGLFLNQFKSPFYPPLYVDLWVTEFAL